MKNENRDKRMNETRALTPEQLSLLERNLFGIGAAIGFVNGAFLGNFDVSLEAYFITAIPIFTPAYIIAYQLTFKDKKNSFRIGSCACGGYLVGEALEMLVRNYL
ncbi:hypothetical protein FJZ18_00465 [Candidatus Pacearchaeota archaeon]|nr:hypothetical protein [Candidatus Pacearchaeota archaeon]